MSHSISPKILRNWSMGVYTENTKIFSANFFVEYIIVPCTILSSFFVLFKFIIQGLVSSNFLSFFELFGAVLSLLEPF